MRLNENTKIVGERVILVPYSAKHVEKYHNWMQNEELQMLTASEPLTLEQEYEMQRSWRVDEDKCTFLVLCRRTFDETGGDELKALVGDTNLFLHLRDECDSQQNAGAMECERVAEAEIMIAEPTVRGKGYGWEAMLLMLKYGQKFLEVQRYEAKIGIENVKSLRMFEKMQFVEQSRSAAFQEVTMSRSVTTDWVVWLDAQVQLDCKPYSA